MSNESRLDLENYLSRYMPKDWVNLSFNQKKDENLYEYQRNIDYGVSRAADTGNNCLLYIINIGDSFGHRSQQYRSACDYLLSTIYYLLHCELGQKADANRVNSIPEHIKPIYAQVIYTSQYILDTLDNIDLHKSNENIQEEKLIRTLIKIIDREVNKKASLFKRLFG